ncbi:hypothetical protein [Verrucomicrobium spinosum]|uniref:hypothetical protein n=1 Tax=Verrucomicrobium spinosum TaxID=2736 RepID=UPI0001745861|nr:hypothetical protein [Verrucomicrobium spinosum]
MGILSFFQRKKSKEPPTFFETLAAMSKMQNVRECSPEFYQQHRDAIDMTMGFLGFLRQQHPAFGQIFTWTNAPLPDIAAALEQAIPRMGLDQGTVDFVDSTMTTVMSRLCDVVTVPELPPYLAECVWPIIGAFES